MNSSIPPRRILIAIAALLATNVITGLVTARSVRSHDFSEMNMNCLLNWGNIAAQFDNAHGRRLHITPQDESKVYQMHEDNARFLVHYPKFNHRTGLDQDRPLTLFCWAVAAEKYRSYDVDIPVDPAVWKAFLADGPKSLPIYWDLRENLTRAGAGQGLIRGEDTMHLFSEHKPPPYKMGPLSTPYHPLPDEAVPS